MAETTLNIEELSFADLRAALNSPAPAEPEAATEAETAPEVEASETEQDATTEPEKTEPETPAEPVEKPKKAEQRFSKLTERAKQAEAKAAALEAELAALRTGKQPEAPKPVEPVAAEPQKPTPPDASKWEGTWEELESARLKYAEDLAEYKVQAVLAQREAAAAAAKAREQAEKVQSSFQEQINAALEKHEEMEEAYNNVGRIVGKMGIQDVIKESSVAADIILALHADKSALDNLSRMSMASAAREIGRLEAGILATQKPAAPAKTKNLPAPPKVVGGAPSGDAAAVDLNKAGMSEFKKLVRKQLGR